MAWSRRLGRERPHQGGSRLPDAQRRQHLYRPHHSSSAGTLSVTGSLVSPITVNSGGTLTNSGTIGGLALAAGGTLASTGTPTTMTVTGAGSFATGSTLNFDITPGGASDFLSIGGVGSLGGATLNILAAPGTYAPGQSYTLLTASGGLNGTFTYGGITGGTYATQPTLGYTAKSVLLDFAAPGAPTHGSAVWKAVPTTGDWNTPANWANNTVPNGSADVATFDKTTIPSVSLSQNTTVELNCLQPRRGGQPLHDHRRARHDADDQWSGGGEQFGGNAELGDEWIADRERSDRLHRQCRPLIRRSYDDHQQWWQLSGRTFCVLHVAERHASLHLRYWRHHLRWCQFCWQCYHHECS